MKRLLFFFAALIVAQFASAQTCTPSFTTATSPNNPLELTVTNTTNFSLIPGSTPSVMVFWGDANVSPISYTSGSTVSHIYSGGGSYTVGMFTYYWDSLNNVIHCMDSSFQTITVNTPCASTISTTNNGGGSYTFTANNIGGGSGLTYIWSFGDGTSGTGTSVTHVYTNSGTYTVSLTSSTSGCVDSSFTSVQYFNGTLNCNNLFASFNIFSNVGLTVSCINQSTGVFNLPIMVSNMATWDFGDNTPAIIGNYPTHTYAAPGTYTITLINQWIDSVNPSVVYCTDTTTQTVTVTPLPPQPNIISGSIIWDTIITNLQQTTFKVWLIQTDSAQTTLTAVDSAIVTGYASASYSFGGHPAGVYYTKAAIANGSIGANQFLPTYSFNSAYWSNATAIVHTGGSSMNKNILMIPGTFAGGPGFVGGNISQGANKGTNGGVPDILVILRDAANNPLRFTYTDANGDYSFGNIPGGTYNVYPEHMNYTTIPSSDFTLASGAYTLTGVNFEHTSTHITPVSLGIADLPQSDLFRIFPNPSNGNITIKWQASLPGNASVTVLDITGREIINQNVATTEATNINLAHLQSGTYFIKLTTEKAQQTQKIIVQH